MFIMVLIPTVGMLAMFVTLQIKTATAPLEAKADVSVRDRGELHDSISELSETTQDINTRERETTAELRAKLTEIESQFLAADHIRNLQYANNLRYTAMLWEKTYGQKFPSEIQFYPTISQHAR